ncbi:MAG: tRNA (N(6)-L-threonylcarbamoyladenosine(37)-C(2))-methylthiotransferase MtaB [Eubacteriales bacterium]|nr:tRNA (N(6)-L-threonylcarbamoyladenosine(37)-C(2))-methylthiotransferase MtaB [Eubacteriales bacterium]
MTKKKAALHNLGCKVNAYETEAMQQMLEENGYEIVPFAPGADLYIINTCSVTNIADRKSRQMLHKARKMNPEAVVVAAGCYVQAAKEEVEKDPAIDLVIGNNKKKDLIAILEEFENRRRNSGNAPEGKETDWVIDINHTKEYEELAISRTAEHTRAYIKVQDGCNQFCSYCIIPYTRGRVRSRKLADVCAEVETLAKAGFQEVVLTGIHLSSYGVDTGSSLLELICRIHEIEGIKRIRLGSLEPRIITEEFVGTLSKMEKICPHFHLSLQSGCDATLKRMNRRYTAGEYFEKCEMLREAFGRPALTTDVIVGFPGETEEEFRVTREFLEKVAFYETHVFKYSRRKGTRAAVMEGQVPEQVKAERSEVLLELCERNKRGFEEKFVGSVQGVLLEEEQMLEGERFWTGYTKEYVRVAVPVKEGMENRIWKVRISGERREGILVGEVLA